MKKLCFLTALIVFITLCEGYSEEKRNNANYNYGSQSYGKETVGRIQANGSVALEGTKVLGSVHVNGSLDADAAVIDSLQINGRANLKNCLIKNSSSINGALTAADTTFQKELSVASEKIILTTCSLETLTVRKVAGFEGIQIIDLRSGTKVTGPIVVASGDGEVWLSSNSEASGEISGAKVYRK